MEVMYIHVFGIPDHPATRLKLYVRVWGSTVLATPYMTI